jgi:hypothetical protein
MFADAAAFYTGLGWVVFPLAKGSKLPAIKGGHGFKDATDDADIITRWAKDYPEANIAIATGEPSGLVVIDVDPRNGGMETIAKLAADGCTFPSCPEARTGNGGLHLFFALPKKLKSSKNRLGKGIDVKSTGGYVVAAPSTIDKSEAGPGGTYRWIVAPPKQGLPQLPPWALAKLAPRVQPLAKFEPEITEDLAMRSLEGIARKIAGAPEGQRNDVLNWGAYHAGELVKQGKIGSGDVMRRLTQAALAAGLPLPEAQATILSGLRSAAGH